MSATGRNAVLLVLALVAVLLSIVTLLPSTSPRSNDLGYHSVCPFAPWSTLGLLLAAGLIWAIRQYLIELDRRGQIKS